MNTLTTEQQLEAAKDTIAGLEKANGELEQEIRNLSKPTQPQPPPGYHLATPAERMRVQNCLRAMWWDWASKVWRHRTMHQPAQGTTIYACPDLPAKDEGGELVTEGKLRDIRCFTMTVLELRDWINARHREKVAALKLARDTDWQHWQGEKLELEERLAAAEKDRNAAFERIAVLDAKITDRDLDRADLGEKLQTALSRLREAESNGISAAVRRQAEADALRAELAAVEPAMQSLRGMVSKLEAELSRATEMLEAARSLVLQHHNADFHIESGQFCPVCVSKGKDTPLYRAAFGFKPTDTEMAEFEAWAKQQPRSYNIRRHPEGDYENSLVQSMWEGWQAARAKEEQQ